MMGHSSPAIVLEAIELLISPADQEKHKDLHELKLIYKDQLDLSLALRVQTFHEHLTARDKFCSLLEEVTPCLMSKVVHEQVDIKWNFIAVGSKLLEILVTSLQQEMMKFKQLQDSSHKSDQSGTLKGRSAPPLPPDTLSIGQQKTLFALLQFIISLGLCPCLQTGVGLPIEFRSEFGKKIKISYQDTLTGTEKEKRLKNCLKVILNCLKVPSLGSLVLSRHLSDLLAGLCQVCYAPKLVKNTEITHQENSPAVREDKNTEESPDDQSDFQEHLDMIVKRVYKPLLVQELLLLQGGPGKKGGKGPQLPRAPVWLRNVCGHLLSDILMKPGGVESVLKGMLQGGQGTKVQGGAAEGSTNDWRKCEAVAKIIASCPQQANSVEEYYQKVAPQVLGLLRSSDKLLTKQFLRVTWSTITAMLTKHPEIAYNSVMEPLLAPLLLCCKEPGEPYAGGIVVVTEDKLSLCIEDLHKLVVLAGEPQSILVKHLGPVSSIIFLLYCFTRDGMSHLRVKCQDLLVSYLKQTTQASAVACLKALVLPNSEEDMNETSLKSMSERLTFACGDEGGVVAVIRHSERSDERTEDWELSATKCTAIVELLQQLQTEGLAGHFFLSMLKELSGVITDTAETTSASTPDSPSALLEIETQVKKVTSKLRRHVLILQLVEQMCDVLGPSCLTSTTLTLQFVQTTLERCVSVLGNPEGQDLGMFEVETLSMAMGLLVLVLAEKELSPEDWEASQCLLPLLQTMADKHPDESMRQMVVNLRVAIATHGKVWPENTSFSAANASKSGSGADGELAKQEGQVRKERVVEVEKVQLDISKVTSDTGVSQNDSSHVKDQNKSDKVVNEDTSRCPELRKKDKHGPEHAQKGLQSNTVHVKSQVEAADVKPEKYSKNSKDMNSERESSGQSVQKPEASSTAKSSETDSKRSAFSCATEDIRDLSVPVQGHGLITLRKLVLQKDPETMSKLPDVLQIFHEHVFNEDSYVYLAAIQGLAAVGSQSPDLVIPVLTKDFSSMDSHTGGMKISSEVRIKIGEVLVKVSRSLGDMIPKYRQILLNTFLQGCRDVDGLVRASSVSNLADVCRLLKFSLGPVLHEVLDCCSSLLRCDPEVQVRQGAAFLLYQLLQGVETDAIQILGETLRDVYRLLKQVKVTEKEESVLLHVHLALQELEQLMHQLIFPQQILRKKIRVLDPT